MYFVIYLFYSGNNVIIYEGNTDIFKSSSVVLLIEIFSMLYVVNIFFVEQISINLLTSSSLQSLVSFSVDLLGLPCRFLLVLEEGGGGGEEGS